MQVAHNGRPLHFFAGDSALAMSMVTVLAGVRVVDYVQLYAALYDATTVLEPDTQFETENALITRWSDRPRTRHAREDQFRLMITTSNLLRGPVSNIEHRLRPRVATR